MSQRGGAETAAPTGVAIRPYRVEDAPALLEAALESVAEVRPFMPWCHPELTLGEIRGWLEDQIVAFRARRAFEFAIVSAQDRVLGGCGLNQIDDANLRANLGYWVRTLAARRGVATAAIGHLVRWAFTNTRLVRLEVVVAQDNVPSLRTAARAGAVREGLLRQRLQLHGAAHDAVMFSFVRGDAGRPAGAEARASRRSS